MKSGIVEAIHAAGGEVFGLTSEPQTLATEASEAWELGFPCVGDPHHEIKDGCRDRGWLNLFANKDYGHLRRRSWASHPKGYFQPGVVAVGRTGRILYRWRCRPTNSNMNGAGQRPTPEYTWAEIQSRLGQDGPDAELDDTPEFRHRDLSWPEFQGILLAHGWFLRPRAFPLAREGDAPSVHAPKMFRRMRLFAAGWLAAFLVLPAGWVALALAAWAAVASVGLVEIHRQFQHVSHGEPAD